MASSTANRPIAVSGLGSIGSQHVQALLSIGCAEILAFDPNREWRERAAAIPGVFVTDRFEDLIEAQPEAMVIAAPDRFHLPQLDSATAAGITTLVEKPLAPSLSEAIREVERLKAREVPVLVGYVLRHRAITAMIRSLVADGAIGEPTSFQVMLGAYGTILAAVSRFAEPEPNRLYRDYSHEWDYLRWIFGPVEAAFAVARTTKAVQRVETPNLVDGLLRMVGGMVGAFHLDYAEPRGTRTLHVVGTGGTLSADIAAGTLVLRGRSAADDRTVSAPETPASALQSQARHLLDVARGISRPIVDLDDGLAALAVTEAAIASAESGHWAQVPILPDPA